MNLRISDALIERAGKLSAATFHEASGRKGALPHRIAALHPAMVMAGRALPVRCPAGDNLQIHYALSQAEPGDVLVVDCGEGIDYGYWGEIMATAAIVRDVTAEREQGREVARADVAALNDSNSFHCQIARVVGDQIYPLDALREPVRLGEIVIRRGDLVFGDADGVVVFPAADAEALIAASEKRDADEAVIMDKLRAGALTIDVYKF